MAVEAWPLCTAILLAVVPYKGTLSHFKHERESIKLKSFI